MFGKILYFDKKTIGDYKAIINGKRNVEIEEIDVSNDKGVSADLKLVGADYKASKSYKAKVQDSLLYDCDEFEKMLTGRDDYFDFTVSAELDITTVPNRSIIKMDGVLEVPEEFDMVKVIDAFKPLFMNMEQLQDMEETSAVALKSFLGNATAAKIPVIFDGDMLFTAKIMQDNLCISYEELSECEGSVTILARIISSIVNKEKPYYDPLKDFLTLNRMMRKSMMDRGKEFNPIYLDSEYRVLEVLAIYQ